MISKWLFANPLSDQMPQSMTALEAADQLHQEANYLLFERGLDALLKEFGTLTYIGSYAMDLMAWPDIDIHIDLFDGADLLQIARRVADWPEVVVIEYERWHRKRRAELPDGDYLQLKIEHGPWRALWKFDIWSLDNAITVRNRELAKRYCAIMTGEQRELIVEAKQQLLNQDGRTPSLSGVHIYQAVFEKGCTTVEQVLKSLTL